MHSERGGKGKKGKGKNQKKRLLGEGVYSISFSLGDDNGGLNHGKGKAGREERVGDLVRREVGGRKEAVLPLTYGMVDWFVIISSVGRD